MSRHNGEWFRQWQVWLFTAMSWFVVTILGEVLGNTVNAISGKEVGNYLLLGVSAVMLVFTVAWAALVLRGRRNRPIEKERIPPPPRVFAPPTWVRPEPLRGRQHEVATLVRLVREPGVAVVVGERDVGTSSVARAAVRELIDRGHVEASGTHPFDLRGRSASAPDDAVAVAARVASAWRIAPPTEEAMLEAVARDLVGKFRESGGTLLLDNVSTPDQVEWLVREWPSDGPRLVVVGEPALAGLAPDRAFTVGLMSVEDLRELWRKVRRGQALPWYREVFRRRPPEEPEHELDEMVRALLRRPGAVIALAQEISRPGSRTTFAAALTELRDGPSAGGDGVLEPMWQAILQNVRAGLSADADWLLTALATLPVTSLIQGAAVAMRGAGGPAALEELRSHTVVEKVEDRYRLPTEYRQAIERTTSGKRRREIAAAALPALSRFYRETAEEWATWLERKPDEGTARPGRAPEERKPEEAGRWFKESEPSFRPLYTATYPDELLLTILDDLCAIADALTRWYLRIQRPDLLFQVHAGLHALAKQVGKWHFAAHAAIRQATAHRIAGAHGRTHRFDDAAAALDTARGHREKPQNDRRVRTELGVRERVERALLAIDRGSGLDEALAELSRRHVESPAVLINLGALHLSREEPAEALGYLERAEDLARRAGDWGARAHSVELRGVARSYEDLVEAVQLWSSAMAEYAEIGEVQGEARCLQHLGAAALTDRRAAGQLVHGDPRPVTVQVAAAKARRCLEKSIELRPRQQTAVAEAYLKEARRRLE